MEHAPRDREVVGSNPAHHFSNVSSKGCGSLFTVLTENGDTWGETGSDKRSLGPIKYNFVEGDDTPH